VKHEDLAEQNVTVQYLQNKRNNIHRKIGGVTRARGVFGCKNEKGTKHTPTIPNMPCH
jgi:hypothetical protein